VIRRAATLVHRWLGVSCCSLFLLWFSSGIGMMYWEFPSVSARDRLERAPALTAARIGVSPAEAYRRAQMSGTAIEARLYMLGDRAVYRFRSGEEESIVYADTDQRMPALSREAGARIAAAWRGQSEAATQVDAIEIDQWTVDGSFRALAPLWKYSWASGEQAYVSGRTGDVVQFTTRSSRIGAYLGPIPHWLYFTPLRRHRATWSALIAWTSGLGTVAALLGLSIGISVYSPARRYRHDGAPTAIPFRGRKRWHVALGLIFGTAAITWAFSGMLSMDPFAAPASARRVPTSLRGHVDLPAFAAKDPRKALTELAAFTVKELELTTVAGEPVYLAALAAGAARIVPVRGNLRSEFDADRIAAAVRLGSPRASLLEVRRLEQYDRYYRDRRRRLPLPVMVARLNDDDHTRYYIDPRTAQVVGSYSSGDWVQRWLYHGLHSLDFPGLYDRRPLWDIVVIGFMLGGAGLSITSLLLAWRVITERVSTR
jgi:hypothetical protein